MSPEIKSTKTDVTGRQVYPIDCDHRAKILIVDDEVAATRLLKLNLEHSGHYSVRTVNEPGEALKAAADFKPDLILLDVMMPGIDGGELASIFRADTTLGTKPIVFLTAAASKTDVRKGHGSIGGLPFLAKPVDLAEVLTCLKKHLGEWPS